MEEFEWYLIGLLAGIFVGYAFGREAKKGGE